MKRFISYGSIGQFRNIIKAISHQARYDGQDENDKPIYVNRPAPTLTAIASEKIHGTNAAVCYSNPDGFWIQSRKNIIPNEKTGADNHACAFHNQTIKQKWMNIIIALSEEHNINLDTHIISVYFEWCGGSIQKKSAMTGIDKNAIIFQHFKVSPLDPPELDADGNMLPDQEHSTWHETSLTTIDPINKFWVSEVSCNIHNIMNFNTWEIEIDFDNPAKAQNEMIHLVTEVIEPASPVGKTFGQDENIGEGVVVTLTYKDDLHKFKVKGEKHAGKSKVKILSPADEAKENNKREFANYACPQWRLDQMFDETFSEESGLEPDIKHTGTFIRVLVNDVMKEETDVLMERKLEPKDVNGLISRIGSGWFRDKLNELSGI